MRFYVPESPYRRFINVQNWQLELAKEFSPNYIRIVQGMLSIAFDRAIVLGIAKKNPSRMVGNIKSKKTKVDFWTLEEFQKSPCFIRAITTNITCLSLSGYYL